MRGHLFVSSMLVATATFALALVPSSAGADIGAGRRICVSVAFGQPGDLAVVNLTPVNATGPGNGQLVTSDITRPPTASNVNFAPGTVDPNVAVAPIGSDGRVCFVNSEHAEVDVVADLLLTLDAGTFHPTPSGAPERIVDTRVGVGGARLTAGERRCVSLTGTTPGDLAVVNLTPLDASAAGNGQLISSDVAIAPIASNVNFAPGTVDPNIAVATIGSDAKVCFVNSPHADVDLVADLLVTIDDEAFTPTATGSPVRLADTRVGLGGARLAPNGVLCMPIAGARPGDVAVVNLTPVGASAPGHGQLIPSPLGVPSTTSNVNFAAGTTDPNVAVTPIGNDGAVCFVNSQHTSVDLVADLLVTIDAGTYDPGAASGPKRITDTRIDRRFTDPVTIRNCPTLSVCYGTGTARFPFRLLASHDGGTTWFRGDEDEQHMNFVGPFHCITDNVCLVSGSGNSIGMPPIQRAYVTVDGGHAWRQVGSASDIDCVSSDVCILGGGAIQPNLATLRHIKITRDQGQSWHSIPLPAIDPSATHAWVEDITCQQLDTPTTCWATTVTSVGGASFLRLDTSDGWATVTVTEL